MLKFHIYNPDRRLGAQQLVLSYAYAHSPNDRWFGHVKIRPALSFDSGLWGYRLALWRLRAGCEICYFTLNCSLTGTLSSFLPTTSAVSWLTVIWKTILLFLKGCVMIFQENFVFKERFGCDSEISCIYEHECRIRCIQGITPNKTLKSFVLCKIYINQINQKKLYCHFSGNYKKSRAMWLLNWLTEKLMLLHLKLHQYVSVICIKNMYYRNINGFGWNQNTTVIITL